MGHWLVLGYAVLGAILGTMTGVLFATHHKLLGGLMFALGSVIGWSLVGGAGAIVNHYLFHAQIYPLDAIAFKLADGVSTASSVTSTLIVRRIMSGKGFPMNRWMVFTLLVLAGFLFVLEVADGVLSVVIGLPLVAGCWIGAAFMPSRPDRRQVKCWFLRNARRDQRFAQEHPDIYYSEMLRRQFPNF